MRNRACQACSLFAGGCRASLRSKLAASRPTTSRLSPCVSIGSRIYSPLAPVGRPDTGYAPSQFIPFDPFLSGGMYCSAAAPFYRVVFLWNAISGVSRCGGRYPYPPGEREGLLAGRRLQLPHVS